MTTPNDQLPITNYQWRTPTFLITSGTLLFIAIAADLHFHGKLDQADQFLAPFLYEHQNWWLVFLASGISGLGQFWFILPLAVVVGIVLLKKKKKREVAVWAAGLLGSSLICETLKNIFQIPPPSRYLSFVFEKNQGFTFPSGHTMAVTVTAGLLALVWMRQKPRLAAHRWAIAIAVVALALLEASALLYVGVHYLTDVLAGLAVSAAWLGVLWLVLPAAKFSGSEAHSSNGGIQSSDTKSSDGEPK